MFARALQVAATDDWFLMMDADMLVDHVDAEALRAELAATSHHDVAMAALRSKAPPHEVKPYRLMYRALPGLTVERAHNFYVAPGADGRKRYLFGVPPDLRAQRVEAAPAVDVSRHILVSHRHRTRTKKREAQRQEYYRVRDRAGIER